MEKVCTHEQVEHLSPNVSVLPVHTMWLSVCSEWKVGARFQKVLNVWSRSVVLFLTSLSDDTCPVKYRLGEKNINKINHWNRTKTG